jgi:hypothetical protein
MTHWMPSRETINSAHPDMSGGASMLEAFSHSLDPLLTAEMSFGVPQSRQSYGNGKNDAPRVPQA